MFWSFPEGAILDAGHLNRLRVWLLMLAMPVLGAAPALGQTQPRLAYDLSVLASPNPFLLPGGHTGAVMGEVSLSPGLLVTTPRGSTLDVGGTITDRSYSRWYGNYLLGNVKAEGHYRDSEYLTIGAMVGYERALAIDILSSSADAASDPRGIRNDWFSRIDAAWRPDAYSLITPALRYERMIYTDSALLRDASVLTGSVSYARRISAETSLGLLLRDTLNKVQDTGSINSAALYATFRRQVSEHTRLLVEVGAERTGGQVVDAVGNTQPASTLLAGRVDLCRDGQATARRLTGCLSGTLNSQISSFGGLRRDGAVTMTLRRPISERLTLRATSDYRRSAQIGASLATGPPDTVQVGSTDAMRQSLMADWTIHRTITLTGTIEYLRRQLITGERVGAGFVGLQLRYQPGNHR